MTKTYEEALESSSAAFQVPPSSIERAWVKLPIFKRSSSNLVYFQALLLHSIYTLETHFRRQAHPTLYLVAHPQFTSELRAA